MMPSPMGVLTGVEPPPFRLPGSHFAAGIVFFMAGSAGLVWVAPELAVGSFLSPRVTGVTHLFTLGWITTSIMGALYQLLPVVLGQEIRWMGLARVTLWIYAPGLILFVSGLTLARPSVLVVGASLLATGVLLFAANLGATLRRARSRDMTWWALVCATTFLVLTLIVGAALASNYRWPFMGAARIVALGTHLHVALVGWVLLVMVGVGQRLLPMFLLSHGADERPGKAAVALLAAGTLLLFVLHHASGAWARMLPGAFILSGVGAFLVQARAFYRTRSRPVLDAGMRSAAAALVVLGAGAAQGAYLVVTGFSSPSLATVYGLTLVLGVSLFVAAHYFKIVPFLVWYHRFAHLAGKAPVPTVAQLYSPFWASVAGGLLTSGVVVLALSVAWGNQGLTYSAAAVVCLGAVVEAAQMALLSRTRPA